MRSARSPLAEAAIAILRETDHVHPNPAGHRKITEIFADATRPIETRPS